MMETVITIIILLTIIASLTEGKNCTEDCPPWAFCNTNNSLCECIPTLRDSEQFRCNNDDLQLSIVTGACVTYDEVNEQLYQGLNMERRWSSGKQVKSLYLPLPLNVSELNYFMCEETWNRTGRLCGRCLPGHSPLVYSYYLRCVECPEGNKNVWKYLLVAFGPLTVFSCIILVLRIKATSPQLYGFLISSQVLGHPTLIREGVSQKAQNLIIPSKLSATVNSISNLDFFRVLYPDICMDVSTLTTIAMEYAVAVYPILLTIIFYFLIELHGKGFKPLVLLWKPFQKLVKPITGNWDSRTTIIDAFVTFFLLSFVRIGYTTVDLLVPSKLLNVNTGQLTFVMLYDADVEYFGPQHQPYAIIALIFCTLFIILPITFLLVYSLKPFQTILSCLKFKHQLIIRCVMDSFQGNYKDGTEPGTRDYRWFAAVSLIVRFSLFILYPLIRCYQLLGVLIFLTTIVLTVICEPYKHKYRQSVKIDIFYWSQLSGLYTCIYLQGLLWKPGTTRSTFHEVLLALSGSMHIYYFFFVLCFLAFSKLKKLIQAMREQRRGYESIESDQEEALPDRLINPDNYNRARLV